MKVMKMFARVTESYEYTMVVPDHWTESDVAQYYRDNGASGEFEGTECITWDWEGAEDYTDDLEDQIPALVAQGDTIGFEESAS